MRFREIAELVGKGLIRTQRMHCKGKVVRMASNTRVGEMHLRSKRQFIEFLMSHMHSYPRSMSVRLISQHRR